MLTSKIFILILSLFTISTPSNKVLFHDTLIVNSLSLSKDEIKELLIQKYKIKTSYKKASISSDYFINPKYNQIYSVTFETEYNGENVIYNFKLKAINENESKNKNNTPLLLILSSIAVIIFIIYLSKHKSN